MSSDPVSLRLWYMLCSWTYLACVHVRYNAQLAIGLSRDLNAANPCQHRVPPVAACFRLAAVVASPRQSLPTLTWRSLGQKLKWKLPLAAEVLLV